ncbi:MAG: hypothetical protein U5K72_16735 [Balneolaceae bacterium]|nr:hypothetical protein [Balneolaceae bacterium]
MGLIPRTLYTGKPVLNSKTGGSGMHSGRGFRNQNLSADLEHVKTVRFILWGQNAFNVHADVLEKIS